MTSERKKAFYKLLPETLLITVACFYILLVSKSIFVALNRGMDWTDEAWVVAVSRDWSREPGSLSLFNYLTFILLKISLDDILIVRIIRVSLYLLICFYFVSVVLKTFTQGKLKLFEIKVIACIASFLCMLVAFSYPPRYISYNELTSWIVCSIIATYLKNYEVSESMGQVKKKFVLIGFLNSLLFFVKFPVGIIFIIITLTVSIMTIRNLQSEHLKITSIRHYLYGFTICVLCFEAATGQAINYFRDVAEIITSSHEQKKYAHESVSLLHTYSSQVISVSKDFGLKLLIPLSFLFLVLKTLERGNLITRRSTPLLITFSTLLLFINGFPVHKEDFWNSAGNWIISLSLLNSTFIFLFLKSKIITGTDCVYMLILNWSTLISGIGTNNTIGGQAIFSIVGLIAVTLIILLSLARYLRIRVTLLALLIGIMSFVPSVVHANTLGMYRVAPIKELNSKVEGIKVLRNIYVTDTDAKLYSLLANISATLEKNARVV